LFELAAADADDDTLVAIETDANAFQEKLEPTLSRKSWKRWNSAACSPTRPTR